MLSLILNGMGRNRRIELFVTQIKYYAIGCGVINLICFGLGQHFKVNLVIITVLFVVIIVVATAVVAIIAIAAIVRLFG